MADMECRAFLVSVFFVVSLGSRADGLPSLAGDGVTDDTAAIQARLDSGTSCVYLPPPAKAYLISKTLRIGSETELKLDRYSVIRLAPKSDCPMIENRCYVEGVDRRISLTGGIWDMANVDQTPNPQQRGRVEKGYRLPNDNLMTHVNGFFWGMAMRFSHAENMSVKGVTIRNPTTYGMAFCHTSYLYVEDVSFDYVKCNPVFLNMDGVHLDGWCHHVKISNLRGTCYDDLVAINANDGGCAQDEGPIHDVDIDGVYADYCHSAVRILSAPCPIERVTIRNVHGNFYTYAVGFTHFFPQKARGTFRDVVLENIFAAKAFSPENIGVHSRTNYPSVWFQGPVNADHVTVRNFNRDEKTVPVASFRIDREAVVRNLTIRDCRMCNRLDAAIPFIDKKGKVEGLVCENVVFDGNWSCRDGK